MSGKTNRGWFFEDYFVGQIINHSVPRTLTSGERAIYLAAYPARHALYSSDEFARKCGFAESPLTELAAFHIIFGKTVPDISLNAVANLGYAECSFLKPTLYLAKILFIIMDKSKLNLPKLRIGFFKMKLISI